MKIFSSFWLCPFLSRLSKVKVEVGVTFKTKITYFEDQAQVYSFLSRSWRFFGFRGVLFKVVIHFLIVQFFMVLFLIFTFKLFFKYFDSFLIKGYFLRSSSLFYQGKGDLSKSNIKLFLKSARLFIIKALFLCSAHFQLLSLLITFLSKSL